MNSVLNFYLWISAIGFPIFLLVSIVARTGHKQTYYIGYDDGFIDGMGAADEEERASSSQKE